MRSRKQKGGSMEEAERRIQKWKDAKDTFSILNLNNLGLTSLPPLPIHLKLLDCQLNNLTTLPQLPRGLLLLQCNNNKLKSLPALPPNLTDLDCSTNELEDLPELSEILYMINCSRNKLQSLPKLPESLTMLYCNTNKLQSLPTIPDNILELSCEGNNLPQVMYRNDDENMDDYLNRIRSILLLQKNLKSQITEGKRKTFAMNVGTHKNNPLNPIVMKNIANFMNENNLKNIETNSLNPSNVEFRVNKNAARKRLATRKKRFHK